MNFQNTDQRYLMTWLQREQPMLRAQRYCSCSEDSSDDWRDLTIFIPFRLAIETEYTNKQNKRMMKYLRGKKFPSKNSWEIL